MRAIQYFTDEQLNYNRLLTPLQIVQFLEDFRLLYGPQELLERSEQAEACETMLPASQKLDHQIVDPSNR